MQNAALSTHRTGPPATIVPHPSQSSVATEFVVGGFTEGKGSRKQLGALLLGTYRNGKPHYSGPHWPRNLDTPLKPTTPSLDFPLRLLTERATARLWDTAPVLVFAIFVSSWSNA